MIGGVHHRMRNRLFRFFEGDIGALARTMLRQTIALGALNDLSHGRDRFHRIAPRRRLSGKHHRIRAIEHSIGDASRHGTLNHRLHHLRGRNHHPISLSSTMDDGFLQTR